jgi:hypothetical protein
MPLDNTKGRDADSCGVKPRAKKKPARAEFDDAGVDISFLGTFSDEVPF